MLYAYYQNVPLNDYALSSTNCLASSKCDQIFPRFIVEQLPHGISGLVIAAIFAAAMSNLSGSLNSLASTTILDFYKPLINPNASEESLLKLSRWLTAAWGVILIFVAFFARNWGSVFTVGLTIASIVYGTMLGAFLLGVLSAHFQAFSDGCSLCSAAELLFGRENTKELKRSSVTKKALSKNFIIIELKITAEQKSIIGGWN